MARKKKGESVDIQPEDLQTQAKAIAATQDVLQEAALAEMAPKTLTKIDTSLPPMPDKGLAPLMETIEAAMNEQVLSAAQERAEREKEHQQTVAELYGSAKATLDELGISSPYLDNEFLPLCAEVYREIPLPQTVVAVGLKSLVALHLLAPFCHPRATLIAINPVLDIKGQELFLSLEKALVGDDESSDDSSSEASLHAIEKHHGSASALAELQDLLGEDDIDLLFIDGDDSFAGCAKELAFYWPLLRRNGGATGGLLAMHDVSESKRAPHVKVGMVWRVLAATCEESQTWCHHEARVGGIGLLRR